MNVNKININQSESSYYIASDIYDVTSHNNGAIFESLSALLNDSNLSTLIPTAVRCGGMTIRFVQSSDNKYVQYRLMANTFNTNVDNWQGVDEMPTPNSKNLAESGGVFNSLNPLVSKYTVKKYAGLVKELYFPTADSSVIYTITNIARNNAKYKYSLWISGSDGSNYRLSTVDIADETSIIEFSGIKMIVNWNIVADGSNQVATGIVLDTEAIKNINNSPIIYSSIISNTYKIKKSKTTLYITHRGEVASHSTMQSSTYIAILPTAFHLRGYIWGDSVACVALFNKDKVFITALEKGTLNEQYIDKDYDLSSYASTNDFLYLVVCTKITEFDTLQLSATTLSDAEPLYQYPNVIPPRSKPTLYITTIGKIAAHVSMRSTAYLAILPTSVHIKGNLMGGGVACVALFNKDKVFITALEKGTSNEQYIDKDYDLSSYASTNDFLYLVVCTNGEKRFSTIRISDSIINSEPLEQYTDMFMLPSKIDVVVDTELNIYHDNITCIPRMMQGYFLHISKPSSVSIMEDRVTFKPADVADGGNIIYSLYDNNYKNIQNCTVMLNVLSKSAGNGTKNCLIIGDSLIQGQKSVTRCYSKLIYDGETINIIGTKGSSQYKHEGIGGWKWSDFLSDQSPFYDSNNSEINFQKYCTDNNFPSIDYVIIALGGNDIGHNSPSTNSSTIATIINNAKTFIDILLSQTKGFPNANIAIGLAPQGVPYPFESEFYRRNLFMINKAYINEFDNGKYNQNVSIVAQAVWLDRVNGMPNTVSVNNTAECIQPTNLATRKYADRYHMNEYGYNQLGDAFYSKFKAMFAN